MQFRLALLSGMRRLFLRSMAALLCAGLAAEAGAAASDPPAPVPENQVHAQSARRNQLQDDPAVARRIQAATDDILAAAERERLRASAPVSDAEVLSRFESRSWGYGEYRLSHIYVALQAEDPKTGRKIARTEAQALARAQALRRRWSQGADFARLAREASDDRSSASSGGELPSTFGMYLADEFAPAVRALTQGQVSPPVRGATGYHLIKLEAYTPATYETTRGMVEAELREEFKSRAVAELLRQANGDSP